MACTGCFWLKHMTVLLTSFYITGVFGGSSNFDYGDALDKTFLFLEAQRSGKLPPNNRVLWRGDSGLSDGSLEGVDLVGGYYDAGDHVKFGLPMAFTVTMMSWSVIQYEEEITAAGQLGNALDAIKWGTDFFIKAHPEPDVLWGEVGDGVSDHSCWERAEDMTTSRQAYRIDASNPGSDLVAETAAAMAAASIVFRKSNGSYAGTLLQHAVQLFQFADKYRGRYDQSISKAAKFYTSASGYNDELLWGASWLYQATEQEYYLQYVVDDAQSLGGDTWSPQEFSWDNKYAGVQILATKVLMEGKGRNYASTLQQYRAQGELFLCSCIQKNNGHNVLLTQGGLIYVGSWNMQYVTNIAFLLAVSHDYLMDSKQLLHCPSEQVQPSELLSFAESQAEYILGKNPKGMSFMVGYGTNFPSQPHHRGASIVSKNISPALVGCTQGFSDWYNKDQPNPNVLVGAVVGGPDRNDQYQDKRYNYDQAEPTTYINAPLVGLFAKLNAKLNSVHSLFRPTPWQPPKRKFPRPGGENTCKAVQVVQKIRGSWTMQGKQYYNLRVTIHNVSMRPISQLILSIKNLHGPLWGLSKISGLQDAYTFPPWLYGMNARSHFHVVYNQPHHQAKISVLRCK